MTGAEKLEVLRAWKTAIEQADAKIDPVIGILRLAPESPIRSAVWGLQDALTRAVGKIVGDKEEWLSWYAHDNAMGDRGYEAQGRSIRTLEDLLWLVDGCKDDVQ